MPIGAITRGTTNTNRLRRVDRWIAAQPVLRRTDDPLVVDLGYGASGVTALELQQRLAKSRADVEVIGLEISPERVATANRQLESVRAGATPFAPDARVSFALGGFETPLPRGRRAAVIRAFNVLRQYDEGEVVAAWQRMAGRLQGGGIPGGAPRGGQPSGGVSASNASAGGGATRRGAAGSISAGGTAAGGMLVEGTCDEIGRVSSWVALSPAGPQTFTLSLRLAGLEKPSIVAERLPKVLIHRNVEGERIHSLLTELDEAWQRHAPLSVYGPRQRWVASIHALAAAGWPVLGPAARWRLGELTLPWASVSPLGFAYP
ncbi:class I SAM-dependent methyltransferase [Subtercola endophyticus]|uniref:class I SAM-dependent methyltransferase n=1 Tax=Subtercola endophyticus TaxID=2895559 RepID=UPI001E3F6B51|nr:class I SAM-dependent methyltransferase [Subtercola endophyticus]UFS59519.1 class I SAM-dependent methyltransferase [Subtercola endophyticus]